MSNIDKLALREAAENALSAGDGDWQTWREAGQKFPEIFTSSGHIVATVNGSFSIVRADFIAAANPHTVLALLDELEAKDAQITNLTAERDALREGEMADGKHSNTRAAADIYFQLVEECEIPAGGSLVEYVSELRDRAATLQSFGNSEQLEHDRKPELAVWYGAMPETNGKTNWTAILHRKGQHAWEGITIERSEYPDRVRYEADRMSHLIGELDNEPDILAYDADAYSGYVNPGNSPVIKDGWVACSERMPEQFVEVLACTEDGCVYVAALNQRMTWDDGDFFDDIQDVTHWQPLPSPPAK